MIILKIIGLFYLLWFFYLAVMSLMRAHEDKKLTLASKILGYPVLLVGVLLDVFINVIFLTVLFFDLPREWMTTIRLRRYLEKDNGWRKKVAYWVCSQLLDAFDPDGNHCQ